MATQQGSTIVPCLLYRDAPAMIEWLCTVFGFSKKAIYMDGSKVAHAELTRMEGLQHHQPTGPDRLNKPPVRSLANGRRQMHIGQHQCIGAAGGRRPVGQIRLDGLDGHAALGGQCPCLVQPHG